jgi:chromosome partitioning protein
MNAIISAGNLKGGAGKSTIAVNFACALQEKHSVDCRLIDADRQRTVMSWATKGHLPVSVTSATLLEATPDNRYPGMIWITQIKALAEECEMIVINLPPGLEHALATVTAISDVIVAPVNPSGVDFHATTRFVDLIQKSREARGTDKPDCPIVPNRIDG